MWSSVIINTNSQVITGVYNSIDKRLNIYVDLIGGIAYLYTCISESISHKIMH